MRTIYNGLKLNQPKEVNELGYEETINFNIKLINALVLHVEYPVLLIDYPTIEDLIPSHHKWHYWLI